MSNFDHESLIAKAIEVIELMTPDEFGKLRAILNRGGQFSSSRHYATSRRNEIIRGLPRWCEELRPCKTAEFICHQYARYQRSGWPDHQHLIAPPREIRGTIDAELFELCQLDNFPGVERIRQILRG